MSSEVSRHYCFILVMFALVPSVLLLCLVCVVLACWRCYFGVHYTITTVFPLLFWCCCCYFGVVIVVASTTTKQLPMRHADAVAFRNVHNKHAIAIAIAIDMDIDIDIVIDIVVV